MVTKIKDLKVLGKVPNLRYLAILEDGTEGFYEPDKSPEIGIGSTVNYEIEVKISEKTKKPYNLFSFGAATEPITPREKPPIKIDIEIVFKEKCKASRCAARITMEQVYNDNINFDKVKECFMQVNQMVWDAVDDCARE